MNNIQEIASNIFNKSSQTPQSIQLKLPDSSSCKDVNHEIFSILLEIFHHGMVKYHGKQGRVNMDLVTEDDFLNIRKYFWSFGFEIFYKIFDTTGNLLLENKVYDKTTDLFNKYITLETELFKYEISFDYYQ